MLHLLAHSISWFQVILAQNLFARHKWYSFTAVAFDRASVLLMPVSANTVWVHPTVEDQVRYALRCADTGVPRWLVDAQHSSHDLLALR